MLADDMGTVVAWDGVRTRADGSFNATTLWPSTGIAGCECQETGNGYLFNTFDQALQNLDGKTLVLSAQLHGEILVERRLRLTPPSGLLTFVTDAERCPLLAYRGGQDLYVEAIGVAPGDILDIVFFRPGAPLVEIRPKQPEGDVVKVSEDEFWVQVWRSADGGLGDFVIGTLESKNPGFISISPVDPINSGAIDHTTVICSVSEPPP
ncbi:MAG: hypothetical protein AAGM22_24390 [Acidobacteriota bacterium]